MAGKAGKGVDRRARALAARVAHSLRSTEFVTLPVSQKVQVEAFPLP